MADPSATAPTVTVLMPTYNAGVYLRKAIDSVLDQSYADLELLVIDDGSTDDTPALMAGVPDPRVKYVRHERNRGLVTILNEGLDMARGRYVARMDSDDVMHPDRLAKQVDFLEQEPGVTVVASFVDLMDRDGTITGVWETDRATPTEAAIRSMMARTNCIAHPSVMVRRSLLGTLRYSPDQKGAEDWDLWLRLLARGHRIAKIAIPLLQYRVHPASAMATSKKAVPLGDRLLRIRRRYLLSEWSRGAFHAYHLRVIAAQWRTRAGLLKRNMLPEFARGIHRLLTYSPFKLMAERRALRNALDTWKGRHAFVFSYLNTGGAEQVHADILAAIGDQRPIVFITGFSKDRGFAARFAEQAFLVEIPRLLHHPFTARSARRWIVEALDRRKGAVLFGANTDHFALWAAELGPHVKLIHLIHAFLHQAHGNHKHKEWLSLFPRMHRYVFIADQARLEFERFLVAHNMSASSSGILETIHNAVHGFGQVERHELPGLLFVGRDAEEKRLDLFLRIADELQRAKPDGFRFTVMGADPRSGHDQVRFLGTVTDTAERDRIYRANDLLVLTSSREGFPMVIMEAMAQGLGIIATPVGDIPGRIDARFGMVGSSADAETTVREMVAYLLALSSDRERLETLREASLSEARSAFNMEVFKQRYRALLITPEAES